MNEKKQEYEIRIKEYRIKEYRIKIKSIRYIYV
jgi:hypothetical protein